jgi:hypothetical protein
VLAMGESMKALRAAAFRGVLIVSLVSLLAGCAMQQRPHSVPPLVFRHCAVTTETPGFIGCDCIKPLIVWDAQSKRKVIYCDGIVQQ